MIVGASSFLYTVILSVMIEAYKQKPAFHAGFLMRKNLSYGIVSTGTGFFTVMVCVFDEVFPLALFTQVSPYSVVDEG